MATVQLERGATVLEFEIKCPDCEERITFKAYRASTLPGMTPIPGDVVFEDVDFSCEHRSEHMANLMMTKARAALIETRRRI
jgi:hypothetical protein